MVFTKSVVFYCDRIVQMWTLFYQCDFLEGILEEAVYSISESMIMLHD